MRGSDYIAYDPSQLTDMVRSRKCDVCRERKVKCDETQPSCLRCRKAGRICSYTASEAFIRDGSLMMLVGGTGAIGGRQKKHGGDGAGLEIKSIRGTSPGAGTFRTYKLTKGSAPTRIISSDGYRLASRWAYMLGPIVTLGSKSELFYLIPARIGVHPAVDTAAEHALDCRHAWMLCNFEGPSTSWQSGSKALQALRKIMKPGNVNDEVLLSVALLSLAECFKHFGGFFWGNEHKVHVLGLANVLGARLQIGQWGQLEEHVARAFFDNEILVSVCSDTPSVLDNPARPAARASMVLGPPNAMLDALDNVIDRAVKLPRLICLLRRLRLEPGNEDILISAIATARGVFANDDRSRIQGIIMSTTTFDYVDDQDGSHPSRRSLIFAAVDAFNLAVVYYMYETVLCGIILTLFESAPEATALVFDRSSIEHQDVYAAGFLVRCIPYALRSLGTITPWTAVRMVMPLTVSCGTWKRLSDRSIVGSGEYVHATDMKRLGFETVVKIMESCGDGKVDGGVRQSMMEDICGTFVGGEIPEWMNRS